MTIVGDSVVRGFDQKALRAALGIGWRPTADGRVTRSLVVVLRRDDALARGQPTAFLG